MNRDQHIADIRAACIKANPEIVEQHSVQCDMDTSHGYIALHAELGCEIRPVRLADVLLAMGVSKQGLREVYQINPVSLSLGRIGRGYFADWNLRQDDLTLQDDECLEFLADLIK